jgi:threonine aldolase
MDGARLLTAAIAAGVAAAEYGTLVDTVWIDLSKGLGCPVGAVLAGSDALIDAAWDWKHRLGGAMRQAGILAAAGLYALDHHVDRLADDHARARRLAEAITEAPGVTVDLEGVQSNMAYFDVAGTGLEATTFTARCQDHGLDLCPMGGTTIRAVTHLDVDTDDVDNAARIIVKVAEAARSE